jgi:dihydroflavonol-4-reductase
MKLAVTGAAGLIGAHVVRASVAAGHATTAILRVSSSREALAGIDVPVAIADMLGPRDALVEAFGDSDMVVHTAATFAYGGDGAALHRVAIEGTANVLHAAAAAGVRRVVVTSSSVVFGYAHDEQAIDETRGLADGAGQPAYVAAKIAQDRSALDLACRLGLELILACPTMSVGGVATTLGPSNALIVRYLADPTRSTFPGGCNIVAARDVGAAHVLLAARGEPGEHYLLGSENLRWAQIHALIGALAGVGGPYGEIGPRAAGLVAGAEALRARISGRVSLASREEASMLGRYYWYDHGRAAALGYQPQPAAQALLEAVSWLTASPHVSRAVRATIHLNDAVQCFRYTRTAA